MIKFSHLTGALRIVIGMAVGVTLWANFGPSPEQVFQRVIVPDTVLVQMEPDTVVKFVEKIKLITVKPGLVALAPDGAQATVNKFCTIAVDTVHIPGEPIPALVRSGTYSGSQLRLWEVSANGDLTMEQFKARSPFKFTMRDDGSALVQSSRWWFVDDVLKGAALVAGGYAAGRIF